MGVLKMVKQLNKIISIHNRKTSMRLTTEEWEILDTICYNEKIRRKELLELIEDNRDSNIGLTPAVRLFSLLYLFSKVKKTTSISTNVKKILEDIQ